MRIILGSQSKYRKKILQEMGYDFEVMVSDIDEKAIRNENPRELSKALAIAKADKLQKRIDEPVLLITADQVVAWKGEIREKPKDEEEARIFLHSYHEAPAEVTSAVVVTNTQTGKQVADVDMVRVVFKEIPEFVIDHLIENADIFSKAGGFSIDDSLLNEYIESVDGTNDSVEGLPKELTEKLLKQAQA